MEVVRTNLNTLSGIIPLNHENLKVFHLCSWIAVTFISFFIAFNFLAKFSKAFVIHEAIPQINQFRLINALWRVVFSTCIIVLFFVSHWDANKSSFKSVLLQATVSQCNSSVLEDAQDDIPSKITFLVVPVSFFLHELYISISSFTEPAVVSMGCLSLFVLTTNFLECPNLCLQILFFLALNMGSLELARTVYALKSRFKGFRGPAPPILLSLIAFPIFSFHLIVWIIISFYLFPLLYFSRPSISEVEPPLRTASAYINIFLIFFAKKQFFNSPAWSVMKLLVRKPSEVGRISSLQSLPVVVLLPYTSPLLPELRTIQMKLLLDAVPTSAERRMMRKKILSTRGQTSAPISEEKADLLGFIQCVKILKRKMRYRYEQKIANEASTSEQSNLTDNSPKDDSDEASESPSSPDVTDIFVPVPPFMNEMEQVERDSNDQNAESTIGGLEITAVVHTSAEKQTDAMTDSSEAEKSNDENQENPSESEENI